MARKSAMQRVLIIGDVSASAVEKFHVATGSQFDRRAMALLSGALQDICDKLRTADVPPHVVIDDDPRIRFQTLLDNYVDANLRVGAVLVGSSVDFGDPVLTAIIARNKLSEKENPYRIWVAEDGDIVRASDRDGARLAD